MAVKPSSTALDISSEGSPVMPSVRVLYQPKPLQQNRATAEMESAHQLVEELAGPLFQMQAVADGEAHQDGQHHGRQAARRYSSSKLQSAYCQIGKFQTQLSLHSFIDTEDAHQHMARTIGRWALYSL